MKSDFPMPAGTTIADKDLYLKKTGSRRAWEWPASVSDIHIGQALMEKNVLVYEQQPAPGAHVRIWRYQDGRFLLEYMKPPSRRMMVFCPSFEEALSLWRQIEHGESPSSQDGPTNLTDRV